MTHVLDQIVESIRTLLTDTTDADDRVTRDRSPRRPFQGRSDLPAIDIRVGDDDPLDLGLQPQGVWRSEATVYVDLYTYAAEVDASADVLELRAQVDRAIMADAPRLSGVELAIRVLRNGAEAIQREDSGQLPIAYCRTAFTVLYQHSLTDPAE